MQGGLNSVSMAAGVMEKALYSSYTRVRCVSFSGYWEDVTQPGNKRRRRQAARDS